MTTNFAPTSRLSRARVLLALILFLTAGSLAFYSFAATPSNGTLSEATPVLTYTAGPFVQSNPVPVPLVQSGPTCNGQSPCDSYRLTTDVSAAYLTANPAASAKITLSWTDTGSGASDYDLYVYAGDVANTTASTQVIARSASSGNPEITSVFPLTAGPTVYTIKVVPYTATGESIMVKIELLAGSGGVGGFPGFGNADPVAPGKPRYQTFTPPANTSAEAGSGEMNIGFNPLTKRFMLNNAGPVWRVTPAEVGDPNAPECCNALWEDRSSTIADAGVDPILWTDPVTGRTFASNFTGGANALYAYSDSDGEPTVTSPTGWTVLGAAVPNGGADHQTIASGPYPAGIPNPNPILNGGQAVYYCSQAIVGPAFCQRSDDLGASYGPGTLAYDGSNCAGLHGHVRVGPDGTVYLPVPDCGGKAGVAVSSDAGLTWKEFFLPNSLPQSSGSDSSISIGPDNKLYYFYIVSSPDATKGTMHVQTGTLVRDGANITNILWANDTDLGETHGIVNSAFPQSVAGSAGRAAVGYLGTDIPGNFQSITFPGYWYPFMSTTYDGGQTWVTVNVTPNDPVQGKGGIWQMGGSQTNRNLLDFNEMTIDHKGRPIFAWSDGCVGDCVGNPDNNTFTAYMRMTRQTGGKTLFASEDANVDTTVALPPKAPCLSGTRDVGGSRLRWIAPDNGGTEIAYYKIFRGTSPGTVTFLADTGSLALPNARLTYDDLSADPAVEHYYYRVQAVNTAGLGAFSNEIDLIVAALPPVQTPCALPGITVLSDPTGDSAVGQQGAPQHDIQFVSVAEPYYTNGAQKLVFTIKVADLSVLPPNTTYPLAFKGPDGNGYYVGFRTSAPATVATPQFEYGTAVFSGTSYTTTYVGLADAESGYQADGTIRIVVPRNRFGTAAPGLSLNNFFLRVRIEPGVTPDNCPDSLAPAGNYSIVGNGFCAPQVELTSVVSRKTHGSAGNFDVELPLTGSPGVEPRGANGQHKMIFKFGSAVTSVGSVSVTGGGNATGEMGPAASEYTVNLSGIADVQDITVTLQDVVVGPASAPSITGRMRVLAGDATANSDVNSSDIALVKSESGNTVSPVNFLADLNVNGVINSSDIAIAKSKSGNSLPPAGAAGKGTAEGGR